MRIAGIDYSLTSPAICVWKKEDDRFFDFDSCDVYYLETPSRRKRPSHGILNLHSEPYPEWETEEERHELLSKWTMSIITGCEVFIEGYAFATVGKSHVRSVAEGTGLLKNKMWKMKIPFTIFPPTVIKKHATGKGNADKQLMYNTFCDELLTPTDLKERLTPKAKKIISPISDIVDSYFIAKCGIDGVLG